MVSSFSILKVTSTSRLLIAVLVWLLLIFAISGPFFKWSGRSTVEGNGNENAEMILARLSRANSELNTLKTQNEELRELLQSYLPAEVKLTEKDSIQIHEPSEVY